MSLAQKVDSFRAAHKPGAPFIIPNPWDEGSARVLEGLGFKALATTSSGFALTKGRLDYGVTREEVIDHCRDVAGAVDIPVTADLENGFGPKPEDVAETIRLAAQTDLAGGSIEDSTGDENAPTFEHAHAVERVAAAVEAARASDDGFVLTARAEAYLYGKGDIDETLARLNAFAEVGADVLYAPGISDIETVRAICAGVDKPVNVLLYGGLYKASLDDLAKAGAARISVGGALAWNAYGALALTARALAEGDFAAMGAAGEGAKIAQASLKT